MPWSDLEERWSHLITWGESERASGMKLATLWRLAQVRNIAGDDR